MLFPLSQNDIDQIRIEAGIREKVEIDRSLLEELIRNYKPSNERLADAVRELRQINQDLRGKIKSLEANANSKIYDT